MECTRVLLRPDWVHDIAHRVESFTKKQTGPPPFPASLVRSFVETLPTPHSRLESWLLQQLTIELSLVQASPQLACVSVALSNAAGSQAALPEPLSGRDAMYAESALQLLTTRYCQPWTVELLAKRTGCNRTLLQQLFRKLTGVSIHKFLVRRRVVAACILLRTTDLKVGVVPSEVGYRSAAAFHRHFKKICGVTPRDYRRRYG